MERCEMKIEKFYDVHFLHTMPYLAVLAFACLGIANSPELLTLDAMATGGGQYIYEDNGSITDLKKYEEKLKGGAGILLEEKTQVKITDKTGSNNPEKPAIVPSDNTSGSYEQNTSATPSQNNTSNKQNITETGSKTRLEVNIINKNNPEHTPNSGAGTENGTTGAPIEHRADLTVAAANKNNAVRNEINITGRTIGLFKSTDTLTDSGNMVAEYGNKFLYGHNTAHVFGGLSQMREGETFSLTRNGVTKKFVVAKKELMTKDRTADFMMAIVNARFMGQEYDLLLMTCAGEPRPNMDASHRLLLFAKNIQ